MPPLCNQCPCFPWWWWEALFSLPPTPDCSVSVPPLSLPWQTRKSWFAKESAWQISCCSAQVSPLTFLSLDTLSGWTTLEHSFYFDSFSDPALSSQLNLWASWTCSGRYPIFSVSTFLMSLSPWRMEPKFLSDPLLWLCSIFSPRLSSSEVCETPIGQLVGYCHHPTVFPSALHCKACSMYLWPSDEGQVVP